VRVGPEIAGALLVAAGDTRATPQRGRILDAMWRLSDPASSGKTVRHRLNRGGNRQANTALDRMVVVRLCWHQPPGLSDPADQTRDVKGGDHPLVAALVAREVFAARHAPTALADTT
jgi:hypothetical protein